MKTLRKMFSTIKNVLGSVKILEDLDNLVLVRTIGIVKYYRLTKRVKRWFFVYAKTRMSAQVNYVHVRIFGFEFDGLVKI